MAEQNPTTDQLYDLLAVTLVTQGRLAQKLEAALRVLREEPHADSCPASIASWKTCKCWKTEMAGALDVEWEHGG